MRFIALDLETTGLDPKIDTIIEIAAIGFELEKHNNTFHPIHIEERSMLINPDRELKQEVTMITGIDTSMLVGKEKWEFVRERVQEFIGDAIIVGHNVLFDIAMLSTHGIDLSRNKVIDTFELSEIFSQDVESLNLSFLAKHYKIEGDGEHRALDDTRLSIGLFIHYLKNILLMDPIEKSIFGYFSTRDIFYIIETLFLVCETHSYDTYIFPYTSEFRDTTKKHTFHTMKKIPSVYSLNGDRKSELDIFTENIEKNKQTLLITNGKKQSEAWKNILEDEGHRAQIFRESHRYCSMKSLYTFINQNTFSRKELIFGIKMLFWLKNTNTGILDELKYYGNEHRYIKHLYCDKNEYCDFRVHHEQEYKKTHILISDIGSIQEIDTTDITLKIFRDIVKYPDILRKKLSQKICLTDLIENIELLSSRIGTENIPVEIMRDAILFFQHIAESIHPRPIGELPIPPGEYGETYFFTQKDLWHRGEKWLKLYMGQLQEILSSIHIPNNISYLDQKIYRTILSDLATIISLCEYENINIGIILSIQEEKTTLTLIHREVKKEIYSYISGNELQEILLMDYGIYGNSIQNYIKNECGVHYDTLQNIPGITGKKQLIGSISGLYEAVKGGEKIIIFTTSNKDIRKTSQELSKKYPEKKIFTQGISGGKGKILSLFEQYTGEKILIGLIDTWIDESRIWKECDRLILAKLPFDPPTDPYYLARTIGMRNNFEEYSCPLLISTLNTLIGRALFMNKNIQFITLDDRLNTTTWGMKIYPEVL